MSTHDGMGKAMVIRTLVFALSTLAACWLGGAAPCSTPDAQLAGTGDTTKELFERSEALARALRILDRAGRGTDREIALLYLLGYGRREIAAALNESPRHVRRVVDRTQLALREPRTHRGPSRARDRYR